MTTIQTMELVKALISILSIVITAFLVPWIKTKGTLEQREFAYSVVKEAVRAAEQIFKLEGQGIEKYDFVIKYVKAEFNLKLSEKQLKVLVEAAVLELKGIKDKK